MTTAANQSIAMFGTSTSGASNACATSTTASAPRGDMRRSRNRTVRPALTATAVYRMPLISASIRLSRSVNPYSLAAMK
jgi:hypothetical protein